MSAVIVHKMSVYPLTIPLRRTISHGICERDMSEPVVVSVELRDGTIGYGETVPRFHVTGESSESVVETVCELFLPSAVDFHPRSFPEALEAIEALPWKDGTDHLIPAARAAVELALLDAVLRVYGRRVDDVVRWMGAVGFGLPGSIERVRFSGVLAPERTAKMLRQLRLMYWGGLRDFKLKIRGGDDGSRLRFVVGYLGRSVRDGRATLRLDANGVWSKDEAIEWLSDTSDMPFTLLEQPLPRGLEGELPILRDLFDVALVHDESLITREDGERLINLGVADVFNIRISKCGGLIPALQLAALARRSKVRIQLGCMMGETSILSAAGLRFLQVCPGVEWAEGCFGSSLISSDVIRRGLRFGYGGKPPRVRGDGLGVSVDPQRLVNLCSTKPIVLNL
ncbi:MAG: hypothetical protein JSU63_16275 [Phycisphaerales bacterium]|nr:MAG: hypothetical protein JSU63_16275 [Phycisphaerales bacterium]